VAAENSKWQATPPYAVAFDRLRPMPDGEITVDEAWAEVQTEWHRLQA
jgi:hypothetical protein